jgi:hypothetical protein
MGASEASIFQLELQPLGTLNVSVSNCLIAGGDCKLNELQTGYAQFEVADVKELEIETVFVNVSNITGRNTTAVGVPVRPSSRNCFFNARLSEHHHFPTGRRISVDTGLAIANPNDSAALVTVSLLKSDGSPFGSTIVELAAGEQRARFLTELFPNVLSSFPSGTGLRVGIQGSLPVAVLALRADVSDEFLLSGVPIFETE